MGGCHLTSVSKREGICNSEGGNNAMLLCANFTDMGIPSKPFEAPVLKYGDHEVEFTFTVSYSEFNITVPYVCILLLSYKHIHMGMVKMFYAHLLFGIVICECVMLNNRSSMQLKHFVPLADH